jgi:hypothetical protein
MSKTLSKFLLTLAVFSLGATVVSAQDTTTKRTEVVKNADGTYTVIEYPVGKEVSVTLVPSATVTGAKGMARVMRSADGTKVWVDVSGVPADTKSYYAYAVDPSGTPTLLGPVTFQNGVAKAEFTTPMNQFMVVLSPNEGLTTVDQSSAVFWSDVPQGYAVIPRRRTGENNAVATAQPTSSAYEVPLLNVPSFGDNTTEVRVNFTGELQGLDGKAYIDRGRGKTQVKMRFGDMKKAPINKRFVLWAASPEGKYTKLGQVVNTGRGDEGEIRSETALADFGLMVTVEDIDVETPTSRTYGTFRVFPNS